MRYFIIAILSSIIFFGCAKKLSECTNFAKNSPKLTNSIAENHIERKNPISKEQNKAIEIQDITIFFDYDSYILKSIEKNKLNSLAKDLKNTSYKLKIDGYCDERGTNAYNLSLGQLRANTVQKYLVEYGIQNQIQTLSYGEERPFCYEKNESCYKINRVVKIQLTK